MHCAMGDEAKLLRVSESVEVERFASIAWYSFPPDLRHGRYGRCDRMDNRHYTDTASRSFVTDGVEKGLAIFGEQ